MNNYFVVATPLLRSISNPCLLFNHTVVKNSTDSVIVECQ